MKTTATLSFAAIATATVAACTAFADGHDVALAWPANYETEFTRYYAGDRQNGTQFIALYANDIALDAARTDGTLPNGSVLVGELFPAIKDADGEVLESALGRLIHADDPAAVVVMERIAGNDARYGDDLKVGDWEFEVFSTNGENLGRDTTACRECHHPLDDTEFLFSYEHLTQKVAE